MNAELLSYLSQLTEEEQYMLIPENSSRSLYAKPGRFLIERRRMSSLSLGESTAAVSIRPHPRFREFPLHSHDYIEIMYVCSGSITHLIDGKEVRLDTDDLIILGKDTRHSILAAGQNDLGINLIISTDLFETLFHSLRRNSRLSGKKFEDLLRRDGLPYCIFSAGESIAIRNLMESMIASVIRDGNADGYILQQSLGLLLCYLAAQSGEEEADEGEGYREQMKKKILNYIHTSYSTATLTEAARMLGLSAPYLSRLCCQSLGESFKELLMRERFSAACELLCATDMPIGDIINHVGYENSSYFHKEFKKRYGMTPKEYRRVNA